MSLLARAAQFAPFAALDGYGEAIHETARATESRRELDEQEQAMLDMRLRFLAARIDEHPQASITYFAKDSRKSGGAYIQVSGAVMEISVTHRHILLHPERLVCIDDIRVLESPIFNDLA